MGEPRHETASASERDIASCSSTARNHVSTSNPPEPMIPRKYTPPVLSLVVRGTVMQSAACGEPGVIDMTVIRAFVVVVTTLALPIGANADQSYSPPVENDFPDHVFWGDTHLHTHLSTDANAQGNKNISPADAYVLARGGTIRAHNGMEVKLHRPLDFLVIADHAENLGVANAVQRRDPVLRETSVGTRLADMFEQLMAGGSPAPEALREFVYSLGTDDINDDRFRQTIWNRVTRTADQYNEPGKFAALIGYEWTSRFEDGTRHRVVIFKDGAEKTNQVLPFSARDSANPEDLWRFLARYEEFDRWRSHRNCTQSEPE